MAGAQASYSGHQPKEVRDTLALRLSTTIEMLAKCESELYDLRTKISGPVPEGSSKEQSPPPGIHSQTMELQARSQRIFELIDSISRAVA